MYGYIYVLMYVCTVEYVLYVCVSNIRMYEALIEYFLSRRYVRVFFVAGRSFKVVRRLNNVSSNICTYARDMYVFC